MSQTLTIVGNGFDLHHRIPSSYSDFRRFLKTHDGTLFRRVSDYLPLSEGWADLEEQLGGLDLDHILDDASSLLMSYGAEDWRDSGHHDYEYEIGVLADALSRELLEAFTKWISGIEIPEQTGVTQPLRTLRTSGLYFSFNYTPTLEETYGIPSKQILHIHGAVSLPESRLILGHGYGDLPSLNKNRTEDDDMRIVGGNEIIDDYFKKTFKPSDQLILENRSFFERLRSIEMVNVLGHSLSDIDAPYFIALTEAMQSTSAIWAVAVRKPAQAAEKIERLLELGAPAGRVVALPWEYF